VDLAVLSCWGLPGDSGFQLSTCTEGVNGVLTPDNSRTRPSYWVHHAFGSMQRTRLIVNHNTKDLTALADRDDMAKQIRVLLGHHTCGLNQNWCDLNLPWHYVADTPAASLSLDLVFSELPFGSGTYQAEIHHIPHDDSLNPLDAPIDIGNKMMIESVDGNVLVQLDSVPDGHAIEVILTHVE